MLSHRLPRGRSTAPSSPAPSASSSALVARSPSSSSSSVAGRATGDGRWDITLGKDTLYYERKTTRTRARIQKKEPASVGQPEPIAPDRRHRVHRKNERVKISRRVGDRVSTRPTMMAIGRGVFPSYWRYLSCRVCVCVCVCACCPHPRGRSVGRSVAPVSSLACADGWRRSRRRSRPRTSSLERTLGENDGASARAMSTR